MKSTYMCPHCGAIYDASQIEIADSEKSLEHEGMLECWHNCPCCDEIIDDGIRPDPDYVDAETEERLNEREAKERRQELDALASEYWKGQL